MKLLLVALLAAGCGPVTYINEVTRRASADVESARAAQADQFAPYYFTLAVEYLRKAREEAAHADYQAANRLGRKASEAARKAVEIALSEVRSAEPSGRGGRPDPAPRRP
jgi:hypothetical protein